jgi:hypothetical protein
MINISNLLKSEDKNNCWLCNSITKVSTNEEGIFYECSKCLNFDLDIYFDLNQIVIHIYDLIDFGDKTERSIITLSLLKNYININIVHESSSDRTLKYNEYNIYDGEISIEELKEIIFNKYILKILNGCKNNLIFI